VAVVEFGDLDVPAGVERAGGLFDESSKQGDAERGIGGLEDGDVGCCRVDERVVLAAEAGGADEDRGLAVHGGAQMLLQCVGRREIDEDIGLVRNGGSVGADDEAVADDIAAHGVAGAFDSAGEPAVGCCLHFRDDGLAHAAAGSENADLDHCLLLGGDRCLNGPLLASGCWQVACKSEACRLAGSVLKHWP
jgi:hypothetical protein